MTETTDMNLVLAISGNISRVTAMMGLPDDGLCLVVVRFKGDGVPRTYGQNLATGDHGFLELAGIESDLQGAALYPHKLAESIKAKLESDRDVESVVVMPRRDWLRYRLGELNDYLDAVNPDQLVDCTA